MSLVVVRFRLDHPIFRETLSRLSAVELEWIRNVPDDGRPELLVWATTTDEEALEAAMEADPTLGEVRRTVPVGDRLLCQVSLSEAGTEADLYATLADTGSVVREARVTAEGWECHFAFADAAALDRFFESARERGIEYDVRQVDGAPEDGDDALTDEQREALRVALRRGYFAIPRETTLAAVGEELGVSDSAASERLRRAVRALAAEHLERRSRWGDRGG